MKKICIAILLCIALCNCNNGGEKEKAKSKKVFQPGDREGVDTSMIDLEDAISGSDLICQRWDNKEDAEDAPNGGGTLEMPFRGFYLFKDGSMVKDPRDKMVFGTWSYDDKENMLKIILANGNTEQYMVDTLHYNKSVMKKIGDNRPVEYIADGFMQKNLVKDPFYPLNMQWRVKPKAAEDDEALHKRIKDCLQFYYLYYTDNYKRNAQKITFFGLPGCFKWYAGGIHLMKEDKLDKRWTDIFYNAADASKAYIIMDKMISKKYDWDKDEHSWVKQNAGVLKQMYDSVDVIK